MPQRKGVAPGIHRGLGKLASETSAHRFIIVAFAAVDKWAWFFAEPLAFRAPVTVFEGFVAAVA